MFSLENVQSQIVKRHPFGIRGTQEIMEIQVLFTPAWGWYLGTNYRSALDMGQQLVAPALQKAADSLHSEEFCSSPAQPE